jgi:hypothetical protein
MRRDEIEVGGAEEPCTNCGEPIGDSPFEWDDGPVCDDCFHMLERVEVPDAQR